MQECISKQDAISLADSLKLDLPDDPHMKAMAMVYNEGILDYQTQLSLLSPASPQSKIGYWIGVKDKTGHLVWECDNCGWQQRFSTNFCPDCGGLKIEESQENETLNT